MSQHRNIVTSLEIRQYNFHQIRECNIYLVSPIRKYSAIVAFYRKAL
uniref:Uncharacterized protein n=1 Tax=Arundo donax TaxID=35708 RepID=A0A0A9GH05_ARUDO